MTGGASYLALRMTFRFGLVLSLGVARHGAVAQGTDDVFLACVDNVKLVDSDDNGHLVMDEFLNLIRMYDAKCFSRAPTTMNEKQVKFLELSCGKLVGTSACVAAAESSIDVRVATDAGDLFDRDDIERLRRTSLGVLCLYANDLTDNCDAPSSSLQSATANMPNRPVQDSAMESVSMPTKMSNQPIDDVEIATKPKSTAPAIARNQPFIDVMNAAKKATRNKPLPTAAVTLPELAIRRTEAAGDSRDDPIDQEECEMAMTAADDDKNERLTYNEYLDFIQILSDCPRRIVSQNINNTFSESRCIGTNLLDPLSCFSQDVNIAIAYVELEERSFPQRQKIGQLCDFCF